MMFKPGLWSGCIFIMCIVKVPSCENKAYLEKK
jgi:hypothetical protein